MTTLILISFLLFPVPFPYVYQVWYLWSRTYDALTNLGGFQWFLNLNFTAVTGKWKSRLYWLSIMDSVNKIASYNVQSFDLNSTPSRSTVIEYLKRCWLGNFNSCSYMEKIAHIILIFVPNVHKTIIQTKLVLYE